LRARALWLMRVRSLSMRSLPDLRSLRSPRSMHPPPASLHSLRSPRCTRTKGAALTRSRDRGGDSSASGTRSGGGALVRLSGSCLVLGLSGWSADRSCSSGHAFGFDLRRWAVMLYSGVCGTLEARLSVIVVLLSVVILLRGSSSSSRRAHGDGLIRRRWRGISCSSMLSRSDVKLVAESAYCSPTSPRLRPPRPTPELSELDENRRCGGFVRNDPRDMTFPNLGGVFCGRNELSKSLLGGGLGGFLKLLPVSDELLFRLVTPGGVSLALEE
jgi:hypothetical protein